MRFFGISGVVLALGVSAVAGHSYHGFEHGHQSEVSYSGLPTLEDIINEGHVSHPHEIFSAAPEFHGNLHVNHDHISYLEPHVDHIGHESIDDHSHHDLHNFNDHSHHEHHENYVLHATHEHHGNNDHKEEHHKENHKEHDHDHDDDHKSKAKYSFKYGVNDPKTGDVKEQWESRTGDKVKGGYALKEADGTTRVVHYSADKKKGFEATVHKIGHPKGHGH